MHGMLRPRATMLPLMLLLLPLVLLLLLLLGTHLTEAVIGGDAAAAVDKDVAPVGVAQTDLLSLQQEIGGNPATAMATATKTQKEAKVARKKRSLVFGVGTGPAWIGGGYGWGYPGSYGYYSSPYYSYGNYGNYGYYPGYFGFKKIIIG